MRTIEDRIRWLEENWITAKGTRWSLKGREWVRDQILVPLHGWKISSRAREGEDLCLACQKFAGKVVEWSAAREDAIEAYHFPGHTPGCAGLEFRKVQLVVVCLNRRGGKTTNLMAAAGEAVSHDEWWEGMMFAASGNQTDHLFRENLLQQLAIIESDTGDVEEFEASTTSVRFPELHSKFFVVDSSPRSVTGRGPSVLLIEEARDVDGLLFVKALPSILDRNHLTCENGHRWAFEEEDQVKRRKWCPECRARLQPHYAVVVLVSSGGVLDDNPRFLWFAETVVLLERSPRPGAHIFRDDDVANPAIVRESKDILSIFEEVPSISDLVRAERTNAFTQRGDVYISESVYSRCYDPTLHHVDGTADRCVMFLDTSQKKDLLSLTVFADDDGAAPFWRRPLNAARPPPWTWVYTPALYIWDPKDVFKLVDHASLQYETVMWDLLAPILPQFPNVIDIWVDVRGQPWAHNLVNAAHTSRTPWGRKFRRYQHGSREKEVRQMAFKLFLQRVEGRTLRTFRNKRVSDELAGLIKRVAPGGDFEVVDRARKLMHADVVSGLASLCERVWTMRVQRATAKDINERMAGAHVRTAVDKLGPPGGKYTPDSW